MVYPPREVTFLQDGTTRSVTDETKLLQVVADCWGTICTAPDIVSVEVRPVVIGALHDEHLTIPLADATEVGRPEA